ncbi:hypothetical protein E4U42_001537 [Claviceps africana]|uniref:Uncharacterized protein n=1 Tax=Claviceps africana TaxID=83212 RepID=A0A8K0J9T5_9HYPO|nr:hypothetical protein E4U42_001537 [Claviceps africana]
MMEMACGTAHVQPRTDLMSRALSIHHGSYCIWRSMAQSKGCQPPALMAIETYDAYERRSASMEEPFMQGRLDAVHQRLSKAAVTCELEQGAQGKLNQHSV